MGVPLTEEQKKERERLHKVFHAALEMLSEYPDGVIVIAPFAPFNADEFSVTMGMLRAIDRELLERE